MYLTVFWRLHFLSLSFSHPHTNKHTLTLSLSTPLHPLLALDLARSSRIKEGLMKLRLSSQHGRPDGGMRFDITPKTNRKEDKHYERLDISSIPPNLNA